MYPVLSGWLPSIDYIQHHLRSLWKTWTGKPCPVTPPAAPTQECPWELCLFLQPPASQGPGRTLGALTATTPLCPSLGFDSALVSPYASVPASRQIQDLPLSWRWPNQFLPQLQPWLPNPLSCELKTTPQSRSGCWSLSSLMSSSTGSLELKIHFPKKRYYNSESESPLNYNIAKLSCNIFK